MKVPVLETDNPRIVLIEPTIERDAQLGVAWLEGDAGINMIGDPAMRGRGAGKTSLKAVIGYLTGLSMAAVYSRHLITNSTIGKVLADLGFIHDREAYTDNDGLERQNVRLKIVE